MRGIEALRHLARVRRQAHEAVKAFAKIVQVAIFHERG